MNTNKLRTDGKVLVDQQGNNVEVGDRVMYITDGPHVNYGTVKKVTWKETDWGRKFWSIQVLKTHSAHLEKPILVTLSYPTLFKCGIVLGDPGPCILEGS
jgi:hypothetical protein